MFEAILQFLLKYKAIILFYLVVIVFLIIKRKSLDVQAKFIILYRMKFGLKLMDKAVKKFREWIVLLGYIGTGLGFIGMIFITYILIKNLYDLFVNPAATSGVSLVLPGVNVPGLGVLPFWYWIIAIFLIALIHEFSHGIVARSHNIKVKNTGLVLFGPILGAFVEPDEKNLRKQSDIKQYSVLAAGSFSNIILGLAAVLLLNLVFMPLQMGMVDSTGFTFDDYAGEEYPFAKAGIEPGTLITGINEVETLEFMDFSDELNRFKPGESVTVVTPEKEFPITLGENPDNVKKPFLGINNIHNEFEVKEAYKNGAWQALYTVIAWVNGLLRWLFLLSLGIGLFNLLPLPIVDGGRMAQVFLHKLRGPEKGEKNYKAISLFLLLVLVLNLVYPWISRLF